MVKWKGCCTLCDKEVFESKTRFVEASVGSDSVFLGRLKTVDHPFANARRITFVLSDGTEADITFCEDCAVGASGRLSEIWLRCFEAFQFENNHRSEFGFDNKPELIKRAEEFIERLSEITIVSITRNVSWQSLV